MNKRLIIFVSTIIVALLVGIILYFSFNNQTNSDEKQIEEKGLRYDNAKLSEVLNVCDNENCKKIKVESKDASILDVYNDKYILYKDNNLIKLYDGSYYIVNLDSNYSKYKLAVYNDKVYGIIYLNNSKETFYSILNNTVLYKDQYDEIEMFNNKYLLASNNNELKEIFLLDVNFEKVYLSDKDTQNDEYSINYEMIGKDFIGFVNVCNATCNDYYSKVYTSSLKKISSDFKAIDVDENGLLSLLINNKIVKYDKDGNEVAEIDKFKKIINIDENYILHVVNNTVMISTVTENDIEICTLDKKSKLINSFADTESFHIVIEDKKVSINEVWNDCSLNNSCEAETKEELKAYGCGYGYEYTFSFSTKEVNRKALAFCGG